MAISYPVDVDNTRWAVLYLPTGQIIGRNKVWPVLDGSEIPGLEPEYVYLLQISSAKPDYDSRYYTLDGVEVVDAENNELRTTWSAVKRPTEEQVAAAENVEAEHFTNLVRAERELIETRLMVGAILAYVVDQQSFPPKVRNAAEAYIAKATKVWQNRDRLQEILDGIQLGEEPDLDTGMVDV